MALLDLISPEVIKIPIISKTKGEIIRELIEILKDAGQITEIETVYEAVLKREQLGSTGLENGIAVPHAKTDAVKSITISIGIAPNGVDFDALDGKSSYLFFLMLAPTDKSGPHIEILSEIARITQSRSFCTLLINSRSAEEVVNIFKEY